MTISFDIDNTLIPYSNEFEVERKGFLPIIFRAEPIRKGTIQLFSKLESQGHQIWIYTTSFRSPLNLRRTFHSYGLFPSRIINQKINQKALKKHNCTASKNPKLFGIDLHIDDAKGVGMEGEKYGFETVIIELEDAKWGDKILRRVDVISNSVERN